MEYSDAAIVAQVRAGDREAFRLLVDRYSRDLFRLAFRFLSDEAEAQDTVQEALLRAYRNLEGFESRSSFSTWIYRITANCCLDALSKRKRTPQPMKVFFDEDPGDEPFEARLPAHTPDPERQMLSNELRLKVTDGMNRLTAVERVAFSMRHFDDKSIAEISETLGINANAAKNTIFRAVQKMRKTLEPMLVSSR